ncbi:hypothetical protein [Methanospirillum hungatei]|uniref:hypothetical protein n=1 Tax=Methanospirillum hungatei TaxID=2203 RepID=UPI0026ED522D|nr:hypothetical protein [Methanospirillum hungatei]MCA1916404.1 hypothetical protein [Methanospirillum hungatei]
MSVKSFNRVGMRTILLFSVLSLMIVSPSLGAIYAINGTEINSERLSDLIRSDPSLTGGELSPGTVVFFWNTHCGGCHMAWDFLHEFIPNHPEMKLLDYDLYNSTENRTIFDQYKATYNRDRLSVPSMMVGNITLEGTQDIRNHLGEILDLQQSIHPSHGWFTDLLKFFNDL